MKFLAIDLETSGTKAYTSTIWSLAIADGKKEVLYKDCNGLKREAIPQRIVDDLASPNVLKLIHNAPFEIPMCELQLGIKIRNVADTMARELVIQGVRIGKNQKNKELVRRHNTSLDSVLTRYGFPAPNKDIRDRFINRRKGIPFNKEEIGYMIGDVKYLIPLYLSQEFILKRDDQWELGLLEDKVAEVIGRMKSYGIGFDQNYWRKLAERNQREFNRRSNLLPDDVANWNSEKQVKKYFMSKGIYIDKYGNLPDIQLTANNKTLDNFIFMRALHKTVTAYGMNWFESDYIDPDGRVRGDFDQIVDTGRMSSSKPNLQNITKESLHRGAFVSKVGHTFVIADFEGQEIGIMAAASGEKLWIDALLRGEDVHSLTASMLFEEEWYNGAKKGCSFPSKCKCPTHVDLRGKAKVLNFMLAYGGGAETFSKKTGLSLFESKVIIKRIRRVVPTLFKWLEKNGRDAGLTGETFSASPYRRRRVLLSDKEWRIVNQGKNSPIQGAGADMLKLAMISIPFDKYPIALVVHDEIICEVKNSQSKKAVKDIKILMEQTADYITGIKGLIKVDIRLENNLLKQQTYGKEKNS